MSVKQQAEFFFVIFRKKNESHINIVVHLHFRGLQNR